MEKPSRRELIKATLTSAAVLSGSMAGRSEQTKAPFIVTPGNKFISVARIQAIAGPAIYAGNQRGGVTFYVSGVTEIWRGWQCDDLNVLKAGDSIDVKGTLDASGRLIADSIVANSAKINGVIRSVSGSSVSVEVHPEAPTGHVEIVTLDQGAVFHWTSAQSDLKLGNFVEFTGLLGDDGVIRAYYVVVWDSTRRPIRPIAGKTAPRPNILQSRRLSLRS